MFLVANDTKLSGIYFFVILFSIVLLFFLWVVKYTLLALFGKQKLVQTVEGEEHCYRLLVIPGDDSSKTKYYIKSNEKIEFAILNADSSLEVFSANACDSEFINSQDLPCVSIRLTKKLYVDKWRFIRTPIYDTYEEHYKFFIPTDTTTAEP